VTAPAGHVAPSLYYISTLSQKKGKEKQRKTPQNQNNRVKIIES